MAARRSADSLVEGRRAVERAAGGDAKERILAAARAAGATAVRVTSADPDARSKARLSAAFDRGDLAAWPYDDAYAAKASDPRALLPDACSVICIAVAYAKNEPRALPLQGRVSNYAWGHDYHGVLQTILERVCDELARLGARSRAVCDAAPLAERVFAARAGLGWIGKHTNLIVPGAGSFVFLGEVITTLELAPDGPIRKTCGSCARCITACPTGALRGDYTIDANVCISDLTQRTGSVPRELRALMGDWIWGCDLCSAICPPTRIAAAARDERFAPIRGLARPDLIELLALRSGEFRRRFANTAMGWRGAAILRRNAAIALGNSLDRAVVPALQTAIQQDANANVRAHAAWAIGRIGSPRGRAFLGRSLEFEGNALVREEIEAALVTAAPAQAF